FSVQVPKNAIIGSVADIRARITGLAVDEVTTATVVRLTTPEGVLLIEAESAPRSQGKCPGTPMHVVDSAECSGGMAVAMFWGGAWMEYDIPFAKPGQYRLSLRAAGRFTGSPDEKRGKLLLPIAMDGNAVGELTYPDTGKMTGQTLDFVVPSSGMHTIKVEFPVDTGDIFVDYLTIEEKVERPLFPQVAPTP
ncbi:MAG: carbohydrate-binding domain-containing protein, partial [Lentisphaeria bacterium]